MAPSLERLSHAFSIHVESKVSFLLLTPFLRKGHCLRVFGRCAQV